MTSQIPDIEKLVELFQFANNNENQLDDEEELSNEQTPANNIKCSSNENKPTQANINKKKLSPYAKIEPPKRKEVLDPERDDTEELYFAKTENDSQKNWKNTPTWDISYRQSVTPSDVFLGMGLKNPSTSSCENMIVAVGLPGENRQNIDLKIEKEKLVLVSPKFFLDLKLPHPVDTKKGNAQFDKEQEKLIITLVMDRELDLVNF